jgi:hypothetical protein
MTDGLFTFGIFSETPLQRWGSSLLEVFEGTALPLMKVWAPGAFQRIRTGEGWWNNYS